MASDSDSDVDELLIFSYFHTRRRTVRQRRAVWIHDTIRKRRQLGEYHRLVNELREDSFRFKMYFRMSPTVFDQLLALVGPTIQKKNTHYRKCIDPGERLAISYSETGLLTS